MALRPASKTLSSLTGIVVLAAVLWFLLNHRRGRDADAERADKALAEADVEFPRAGPHPAASHVETKIAAIMREKNITHGVVVINNPRGPCGTDPDAAEPFSCGAVIPAILPEGSTLAIWSPKDPNQSVKLSGKAR